MMEQNTSPASAAFPPPPYWVVKDEPSGRYVGWLGEGGDFGYGVWLKVWLQEPTHLPPGRSAVETDRYGLRAIATDGTPHPTGYERLGVMLAETGEFWETDVFVDFPEVLV